MKVLMVQDEEGTRITLNATVGTIRILTGGQYRMNISQDPLISTQTLKENSAIVFVIAGGKDDTVLYTTSILKNGAFSSFYFRPHIRGYNTSMSNEQGIRLVLW